METKTRTLDDVKREYAEISGQAGDLQYRMEVMKQDLQGLNKKMNELNLEGWKLQQEASKAKEETELKVVEPEVVQAPEATV